MKLLLENLFGNLFVRNDIRIKYYYRIMNVFLNYGFPDSTTIPKVKSGE